MDGHDSLTSVEEMTSPPSPKRPRPDYTEANNGKKLFDFPQLLTFRKPDSIQQNTGQTCSENLPLQTSNIQDNFGTDSTVQAQTSIVSITDITETDKLILNMFYDSDGAAAASHDCSSLGKSLQCEPPVVFSPGRGDTDEGRQVRSSSTHVQIVTLTRPEEDVRCQADCSYGEAPRDEGTDMQNGAVLMAEVSNQRGIQYEFCEKPLCNKKMEQVKKDSCLSHFCDDKSFSTKPEVCPSSSLAGVGENNGKTLELQNVASCDGKTEEQFNEGRKQSFAAAGERAVGTVAENMSTFYAKDKCEATKEETVEELSAKVEIETADDTTETQTSVSISQVITEGDNDAASFSVIDPAKWSGSDRPAEEKRNAGSELSASENVCNMDENLIVDTTALQSETVSLPGPVQTEQLLFQSPKQQQYEKDCQSHTEAVTCIAHDKTSDKSDTENRWRPTSPCSGGSAIFDSAEDQRGGSQGTVGDELKEKNQSGSLSGSLDHPEAHVVQRPRGDTARMDEMSEKEITGVVSVNDVNWMWLKEVVLQENMYKVTIESAHSNWRNESYCNSGVQGGNDSAGFADNQKIACKISEVNMRKKTAVEERETEEELNKQEMTSVASEQLEANMADIQLTGLKKLEVESEIMDGKENEQRGDPSEHTQTEIVSEQDKVNMAEVNYSTCNALTENTVGVRESLGETVHEKSQQHNTNMVMQLPSECHQTLCDSLKPASEEEMVEKTLNANLCSAKSYDSVSISNSSYAVFTGTNDFGINSLRSDHGFTALHNCNGRFSPAPSAFSFTKQVPIGGFDTFEKIQLSPDDNDMDSSALGNSPLLASSPCQMLENPQYQVHHSKSNAASRESDTTEEIQLSNVNEHGFLSNYYTCNKLPSPISAADVVARGWPEQKLLCESAFQIYDCFQDDSNVDSSAVSFESDFSDCEGSDRREFEMKTQFDTVLKELKLFFDISVSDMASRDNASSPESLREITEGLEREASKCQDQDESPEEPDARLTSLDDPVEDVSLECEGVAVGSGAKSREGEQEVPLGSCELQEAPARNQLKDTEAEGTEQRRRTWSPSFMSLPLMEQLTQKLLEPQRRLEPLRTCSRPIRVGLSKKAKTRNLHHPHPYE